MPRQRRLSNLVPRYACPHPFLRQCPLPHKVPEELTVVKAQLSSKYGKRLSLKAQKNEGGCVDERVSARLLFQNDPSPRLVEVSAEKPIVASIAPVLLRPTPTWLHPLKASLLLMSRNMVWKLFLAAGCSAKVPSAFCRLPYAEWGK